MNRDDFITKVGGVGSSEGYELQRQDAFEHGRVISALRLLGLASRKNAVLQHSKEAGSLYLTFSSFCELFPTFPARITARYMKSIQAGLDSKWSYAFRKFTGTPFFKAYDDVCETLSDGSKPVAVSFSRIGFADGLVVHGLRDLPRVGVRLDYAPDDEASPIYIEPFNSFMKAIKLSGWRPD